VFVGQWVGIEKWIKNLEDLKDFGQNLVTNGEIFKSISWIIEESFLLNFFLESPDDFSVSIFLV